MVTVTIYIEGSNTSNQSAAGTIDNSNLFREKFHQLFSQSLSEEDFNLIIQPIGSVNQTKAYLEKVNNDSEEGIILIDLDAPKDEKNNRLTSYAPLNTSRIFFMIQEMEAWILSQPQKFNTYAQLENLTRKKVEEKIEDDVLIRNLHPEDIINPSNKLNTILRKYFSEIKKRRGKEKNKPKSYSKTKDGPKLIGLLDLNDLKNTFDEVERLIEFLVMKSSNN